MKKAKRVKMRPHRVNWKATALALDEKVVSLEQRNAYLENELRLRDEALESQKADHIKALVKSDVDWRAMHDAVQKRFDDAYMDAMRGQNEAHNLRVEVERLRADLMLAKAAAARFDGYRMRVREMDGVEQVRIEGPTHVDLAEVERAMRGEMTDSDRARAMYERDPALSSIDPSHPVYTGGQSDLR